MDDLIFKFKQNLIIKSNLRRMFRIFTGNSCVSVVLSGCHGSCGGGLSGCCDADPGRTSANIASFIAIRRHETFVFCFVTSSELLPFLTKSNNKTLFSLLKRVFYFFFLLFFFKVHFMSTENTKIF